MDYSRFSFPPYTYQEYPKWVNGRIVNGPEEMPTEEFSDERADLIAECQARGIDIDKRWGVKKLRSLLQ